MKHDAFFVGLVLLLVNAAHAAVTDVAWLTYSEGEAELYVIGEGHELIIATELYAGAGTGLRSSDGLIYSSSDLVLGIMPAFELVPATFTADGSGTLMEATWGMLGGGMPTGPVMVDSGPATGLRVLRIDFDPYARVGEASSIAVGWVEAGEDEIHVAEFDIPPLLLPRLDVTDSSGDLDDREIDFGEVNVDESSQVEIVTCTNEGFSDLVISAWSLEVTTPRGTVEPFQVTPTNPPGSAGDVVLAPGASIDIEVTFSPPTADLFEGVLRFESTDPGPVLTVSLRGDGVMEIDEPPYIVSFPDPSEVPHGDPVELAADAVDPEGDLAEVTFYYDVNENGTVEGDEDLLLGSAAPAREVVSLIVDTSSLPVGTLQLLAVASDGSEQDSDPAVAELTVLGADMTLLTSGGSEIGSGGRACLWTPLDGSGYSGELLILNDGNTMLTLDDVVVESDGLVVGMPAETELGPGMSTSLPVSFVPTEYGMIAAAVQFITNDVFDDPFTVTVELSVVDQKMGVADGDRLGWSVAGAGDVDGDGVKDVAVSAPQRNVGAGYVHIYSGQTGELLFNITGESFGGEFGNSIAGAGDTNGDGYTDLIIGAPYQGAGGAVYLFRGFDPGTPPVTFPASILSKVSGDAAGDRFGHVVSGMRDFNDDGSRDVLVGAPGATTAGGIRSGRAYIQSGTNLSRIAVFDGEVDGDQMGYALDYVGDLDGDGNRDVVVGAFQYGLGAGRCYVYFLPQYAAGVPQTFTPAEAMTLDGENANDRFARALGSAGDVNDDGHDDLLVGAPGADGDTGRVYLYFGGDPARSLTTSMIWFGEASGDLFGSSVSTAGDVDEDERDEFMVGAPQHDGNGNDAGRVYLFDAEHAEPRCMWDGQSRRDFFGDIVRRGGDMDGDGTDELLIGAWRSVEPGARGAMQGSGSAYVFYLRGLEVIPQCPSVLPVWQTVTANDAEQDDFLGDSVAVSGDWLAVGASEDDDAAFNAGAVYMYRRDAVTGQWGFHSKLVAGAAEANDRFGRSVSISGPTLVVGAVGVDVEAANAGAAYVFLWNETMGLWQQEARLTVPGLASGANFGEALSILGHRLVVGAYQDDVDVTGDAGLEVRAGSAWVFDRIGPATWEMSQQLEADLQAQDRFGIAVVQTASQIVVGARNGGSPNTGRVFVFEHDGTGWVVEQEITAPDAGLGDRFGDELAMDENWLLIGAPLHNGAGDNRGAAYLFGSSGGTWSFVDILMPETLGDQHQFGAAVALADGIAAIGAYGDDEGGAETGAAYVYRDTGGTWDFLARLHPETLPAGARSGWSVAVDAGVAAIGAVHADARRGRVDLIVGLEDCDGDGELDVCQLELDPPSDADENGILDACQAPPCPGDANGDLAVDFADLEILLDAWGTSVAPGEDGDVDQSGMVDFADLEILLEEWGVVCSNR